MSELTLSYQDWRALTSKVARFASNDATTPLLSAVRVFERGGRLMAEATDRYALAFAIANKEIEPPGGFSALIRTATLAQLDKALGITPRTSAMTTLTLEPVGDSALRITASGGLALGDMSMTLPLVEGSYPPLTRLVEDARRNDVAPAPAFTPWVLQKITAAAGDRNVVEFEMHGDKPAYFTVQDESFAGLIVPVKCGQPISTTLLDLYAPVVKADTEAVA